jgi:hypothetical protein
MHAIGRIMGCLMRSVFVSLSHECRKFFKALGFKAR